MGAKLLVQLWAVHSAQSRKNLKLGNWSVTLLLVWDLCLLLKKCCRKTLVRVLNEVSYNASFIWKFEDW